MTESKREQANQEAFRRLTTSEPVLVDVMPAIDVLPGMKKNTILISGPPLAWDEVVGGQREGVLGGAQYEGLASSREEAEAKITGGEIEVRPAHQHGAVGSLAGIYTASMAVFVVRNQQFGNVGYCNFYEGTNPRRLNYGVYDEGVKERLLHVERVVAPCVGEAVRLAGGIALKPIMQRALHMGDELHSRNTAASLLFTREIFSPLLAMAKSKREQVEATVDALTADHYFFLRLSMAAAKATADAAHAVEASSLVTAMCISCKEFGIRVSGIKDDWFGGGHARVQPKLFEGHTEDEITWMGGDSPITETIGAGGFAQAAAFPLQAYQGGSAQAMVERNLRMYDITVGENPDLHIPYWGYRGTPTGIDIFKVVETGILPALDIGIAGRDGGQIGAGVVDAPLTCFRRAVDQYRTCYRR